jgi:hypothetical protein
MPCRERAQDEEGEEPFSFAGAKAWQWVAAHVRFEPPEEAQGERYSQCLPYAAIAARPVHTVPFRAVWRFSSFPVYAPVYTVSMV